MTPTHYDRAPGDTSTPIEMQVAAASDALVYTIGLVLAVILTATSFWVTNTTLLWAPGIPLGLAVLAIAQMGVHLVFFLHLGSGPNNTNNIMALAFGVWVVFLIIAGSCWITANLHANMMDIPKNMLR